MKMKAVVGFWEMGIFVWFDLQGLMSNRMGLV
jgi:hypothetical protein